LWVAKEQTADGQGGDHGLLSFWAMPIGRSMMIGRSLNPVSRDQTRFGSKRIHDAVAAIKAIERWNPLLDDVHEWRLGAVVRQLAVMVLASSM
jgi:hypothetical protein